MRSRSHIAFFIPSLAGGGAERVFVLLSRWFARCGHVVDLVLTNDAGPYRADVPENVNVVSFGKTHTAAAGPALWRYVRSRRPDIICTALPTAHILASWVVRGLRRLPGSTAPKHVVTLHELPSVRRREAVSIRAATAVKLQRGAVLHADRAVSVSDAVADDAAAEYDIGRERFSVIYNPIEVEEILNRQPPAPHPWFQDDLPVMVSAGRFVRQKNMQGLVRALARMTTPARLILLGEGPERANIANVSEDLGVSTRVEMPGFVEDPYDYFYHASVFALASRGEAFGNVVVEALAAGAPVVSLRAEGGVSEILESGDARCGRLVPPGDIGALADALDEVLAAPPDPDRGRTRARDFRVGRAGRAYANLFRSLLGAGDPPTMSEQPRSHFPSEHTSTA
ncbi:glycosyltransferase [Longibacter sp.]|uniref:glycosyltransferase n=1 Tax=Longibacter sp. TaxID=2045415 RepID=UPI003EBB6D2B